MNLNPKGSITAVDPSSPALTCNGRKRKRDAPATPEAAKRPKETVEDEEALGFGGSSHSQRICVPLDRLQQPITAAELMELLHYAALGKTGGVKQPSWCRLLRQKRIKALNVVIVEGLSQSHFYKHHLRLPHLRADYGTRVTFTPSSTDLASGIFSSEVPQSEAPPTSQRRGRSQIDKALRVHPVIRRFGTERRGLSAYVLSEEEMIKKHFPVRGIPGFEEFVCTSSVDQVTDQSPLYGLDCEMCLTGQGYELARVSLVDGDGTCVMDELVKPQNRILNYLTRFSGITAAMLRPVTTTLRDVQQKLRTLLPGDAVLVGHSLNNDLMALKLIHRHVVDTALLYRREFGQKFKLKVLAETVLKRQIQTEEETGHNPTEDAAAALELLQYFIKTGPRQVVELHLEELWGFRLVEESTEAPPPLPQSLRFADVLQTLSRSVTFSGRRSDGVALDLSKQLWHGSDREVLASFRRRTKHTFLSVLRLSSVSDQLKRSVGCQEQQEEQQQEGEQEQEAQQQQEEEEQRVCANLRDVCVVFAGPFPVGFSEREVKRLFRLCGPVQNIRLLNATVRVHAEVEFELLEGALLALKTLDGINIQGQPIKVQRPVNESLLDLDVTLDALMADGLNSRRLYAVAADGSAPPTANGFRHQRQTKPRLTEEAVREAFGQFAPVESVVLHACKRGKRATHAHIQFRSAEDKHAALSSSEELRRKNYLVCPSLTPPHLTSWVAVTTLVNDVERTHMHAILQDEEMSAVMRKLDRRLQKLFSCLPDDALSVVVLPGNASAQGPVPGLCLMEVKRTS